MVLNSDWSSLDCLKAKISIESLDKNFYKYITNGFFKIVLGLQLGVIPRNYIPRVLNLELYLWKTEVNHHNS